MRIVLSLRYHTNFGQTLFVSGNLDIMGNDVIENALPLSYVNSEFWSVDIDIEAEQLSDEINYRYILKESNGAVIIEGERERFLSIPEGKLKEVTFIDTWNHAGQPENAFYT